MKVPLEWKIYTGFGVAFAVLVAIGAGFWGVTRRLEQTLAWADHTHQVLGQLEEINTDLLEMQNGFRGYLIKPQDRFYDAYHLGALHAAAALRRLSQLTVDNPEQQRRLARLETLITEAGANMERRIAIRRARDLESSLVVGNNPATVTDTRKIVDEMKAAEQGLLDQRSQRVGSAVRNTVGAVVASGVFTAVLLGTAVLLVRRDLAAGRESNARIAALNASLALQNGRLEEANRELEAFSYSVSHDLRAPLRHVGGFAALLGKRATGLDETSRHYLATISGAAKRMGQLIDDLLAFSRMGRSHMAMSSVDNRALVAAVIQEAEIETAAPPVEWRVGDLPPVQGDAAMLRQVWVNLVNNAVKYSGRSARPRIEIGGGPAPAGGETVFFVKDNGVGFDMKHAAQLFGVFHRLHSQEEFKGTGIGLAIVRRIVTRHGGRTWAEGRPGEGAAFFFSLPAPKLAADLLPAS